MQPIFRIARNGKIHLCTQSFGSPGDPGVVLIMGATASMMWWPDALCRTLANAGRYVVRFDHRDTGASTVGVPGQADYSVEDLADDVIAVLDEHGLAQAHLVGMSLGAFIAQLIALRDPTRVRSLTLIAAEPLGGEPVDAAGLNPVLLEHFATMSDLDWTDPSSARAFLRRIAVLSASPMREYDQENADDRIDREIERASDLCAAFNHMSVVGDLDRWNLRNIRVPTLVIHGAHDSIIPLPNGEAIVRHIHGSKLHVLEDAGHELHADDLGVIAELIATHTDDGPLGRISSH